MKELKVLLLVAVCFGLAGTTYVIKEGGKEVGRYDEQDGKTETVELNNAPVKRAPVVPKPKKAAADLGVKTPGLNEEFYRQVEAQAKAISDPVKKRNDARREEVQNAIKEMEDNYK